MKDTWNNERELNFKKHLINHLRRRHRSSSSFWAGATAAPWTPACPHTEPRTSWWCPRTCRRRNGPESAAFASVRNTGTEGGTSPAEWPGCKVLRSPPGEHPEPLADWWWLNRVAGSRKCGGGRRNGSTPSSARLSSSGPGRRRRRWSAGDEFRPRSPVRRSARAPEVAEQFVASFPFSWKRLIVEVSEPTQTAKLRIASSKYDSTAMNN